MMRPAWTFSLFFFLARASQAQTHPYHFWAGEIPPYSYLDEKQEALGSLYRIFQALVERMGYKTKVEVVPWKRVLIGTRKDLPIFFIPVARTPEREHIYQWIEPLLIDQFVIYSLQNHMAAVQDKERIKSLRICLLRGSAAEELAKKHGVTRMEPVTNAHSCARLLNANRVDGWLTARSVAETAYVRAGYDLKDLHAGVQLELWPLYLAASKGVPEGEVLKWRSALQKMKRDGTFDRLRQEPIPQAASPDPTPTLPAQSKSR
ncbi:substrate-binding periplasmic protein [Oligoflexus tunisiensis]|uniref:substrate-binding periplasmic protein n=1 Tax=Oligoflexus tunisiensis TaxID=708132 RepID=UPI00159EF5C0|nr:transporter substrate-binding domain-containing protein [Oligoflexus tunisiensis]